MSCGPESRRYPVITGDANPSPAKRRGVGSILKDSKIGAWAGGAFNAALLYVADALAELDVSPLPDVLEPGAIGLLTTAVIWFSTKAAPRE